MLGVHRWMCVACRRFRKQLVEIDHAVRDYMEIGVPTTMDMPVEVRTRIEQALREELNG